jgi:hypothetical protein
MKKHKLDVCGLLETKLHSSKVSSMHKFRMKHWNFLTNATAASNARIVVFWNPSTVKVDLLNCSAQGLHVIINSLVLQLSFTVTFVYGYNTIVARRSLWADLRAWQPNCPWLVMGDFNSVLSQTDKHNGEPVSTYETSDFRDCCTDLGLVDLNFTGCHFTWNNGRVWSKIDRVLVNSYWSSLQAPAHVHFGNPGAFSDHSPAIIRFDYQNSQGKRNFKFFNMWASHENFLQIVSDNWTRHIPGSPMFSLCKKLKFLKRPLKELNQLHFSHISERVARAEAALENHQTVLHDDRDNLQLLEHDKQLRLTLMNLKSVEKMFFSQKLKCHFFKDSDRGSSFFHALMN